MTPRGRLATAALLLHALLIPSFAFCQADFVPPVEQPSPLLSRGGATAAGLLLALALISDKEFQEESQEHRSGASNALASIGNGFSDWRFLVPAFTVGLLAGEIAGDRKLKGTVLKAGAAIALATGVTSSLKYTLGRIRPDAAGGHLEFRPFSGAASFPSGHTTAAFAVATTIADATSDSWSDYLLYTAATLTAVARVNDDRHWLTDVMVGGLIGHYSARYITRRTGAIQVAPTGVSLNLEF